MAAHDRRQPDRRLPVLSGRGAGDAARRARRDRQHRLDVGHRSSTAACCRRTTTPRRPAVIHLSKSLAMEWVGRGLRVNAISPGYTPTPMNLRPEVAEQVKASSARRRWGAWRGWTRWSGRPCSCAADAASFVHRRRPAGRWRLRVLVSAWLARRRIASWCARVGAHVLSRRDEAGRHRRAAAHFPGQRSRGFSSARATKSVVRITDRGAARHASPSWRKRSVASAIGLAEVIVADARERSRGADPRRASARRRRIIVETTIAAGEVIGISSWSESLLRMVDNIRP